MAGGLSSRVGSCQPWRRIGQQYTAQSNSRLQRHLSGHLPGWPFSGQRGRAVRYWRQCLRVVPRLLQRLHRKPRRRGRSPWAGTRHTPGDQGLELEGCNAGRNQIELSSLPQGSTGQRRLPYRQVPMKTKKPSGGVKPGLSPNWGRCFAVMLIILMVSCAGVRAQNDPVPANPPPPPSEAPPVQTPQGSSGEEVVWPPPFQPSEEIGADSQISFPTDI